MWSLAFLGVLIFRGACDAQVMEIDGQGAVTVYDQPALYGAEGVAPLKPLATRSARRSGYRLITSSALASAADQAELSSDLIEAVAWRESQGRSGAVSPAGAIGEMQLMPATARALGVDPRNTIENYKGGASYLQGLLRRYDGDLVRALAAYNAGPGAVDRYEGVPPYRETQAYVAAIMDRLSRGVAPDDQGERSR